MVKEEAALNIESSFFSRVYHGFVDARRRLYTWRHLPWLVLIVSAINVICIGGKRRAFGIFIAALHREFNTTKMVELDWIGDSYAAVGFFLMPFATTLIYRAGRPYRLTMLTAGILIFVSCVTSAAVPSPGYLFLTHTIIHGLGSTLVLCATNLVTAEYFDKTHEYHVLATTFVSGGSYGVLLFGPLFSRWIKYYGWRVAFEICGVLFFFVCGLAAVVFLQKNHPAYRRFTGNLEVDAEDNSMPQNIQHKVEPDNQLTADGNDQQQQPDSTQASIKRVQKIINEPTASGGKGWAFCSWQHMKENPQIFLWATERLMHNLVMYGLMMNLVSYVNTKLQNRIVDSSRINLYFGIGESVIFTIGALTGDKIRGHLPMAYLIGAVFSAIFLLIIQRTYEDLTVVSVLAGFVGAAIGSSNTFLYATSEEVMLVHGSIAFPMTKMVAGVGMLLAPLFSGAIIDTLSYRGFFVSMAVLVCLRVIFLLAINIILYRKKAELKREAEQLARQMGANPNAALTHCCSLTDRPCGNFNALLPRASITSLQMEREARSLKAGGLAVNTRDSSTNPNDWSAPQTSIVGEVIDEELPEDAASNYRNTQEYNSESRTNSEMDQNGYYSGYNQN